MNETDVRACVSGVADELGWKIKSMYQNPLTKEWQISIEHHHVRFKPAPGATVEECSRQLKNQLGLGEIIVAEEIDNLHLGTPDNIYAAMRRLQKAGDKAVEPLVRALFNPDEPRIFRDRIVDTLAMIDSPRSVELLIPKLEDQDDTVRWNAVQVLGDIGNEQAILPLERLARETDAGRFPLAHSLRAEFKEAAFKAVNRIEAKKSKA